ncbi:DUF1540 domain-containing protein [Dethiobacter alkaliphilus]|uniref:DUF1540 domain-containing protein n=1 Tax=Dethiobacter alkaliphilus TaxID=427926 RepID=UPI002225BDEA|nr:DUF1540 domain-containing protein [Dethiobacter alkaliphilus]MCW3490693.1 DUF1540 domain-containing protein [Dethiobacter alkaliphilus]
MTDKKIMCEVKDCNYWQDMNCTAEQVKVAKNGAEDCGPDMTFCGTFKSDKC